MRKSDRAYVLSVIGNLLDNGYLGEDEVNDCLQLVFQPKGKDIIKDLLISRSTPEGQALFIRMYFNKSRCPSTPCYDWSQGEILSPCVSLIRPIALRPNAPVPKQEESPGSTTNPSSLDDHSELHSQ